MIKPFALAIIGSRSFTDFDLADCEFINRYSTVYEGVWIDQIVSGGAPGADTIAKQLAEKHKVEYLEFPADWDDLTKEPCKIKYRNGKPYNCLAGFNRNKDIVNSCDEALVFHDGISRGTLDSIDLLRKAKKSTVIIYF